MMQRHPVSQRLPGSCRSNSDDILAIENGTDDANFPETRMKAENLLDLDLDVFVRFGHGVRMARHGRVKSQETGVKSKASVKCDATRILLTECDRDGATGQTSTYRHSKLCQSLGKNKKNKV